MDASLPPPHALVELPLLDGEGFADFCALMKDSTSMALATYAAFCKDALRELRHCLTAREWETLHRTVHSIKSASRQVGATRLAEQCRQLELLVGRMGEASRDFAEEKLARIADTLDETLRELESLAPYQR